jgi:hypothetical protein
VAVESDGADILRIMSHRHFELFCEIIDGLPPKAVLKAVAMEQHMLDEDLALGRTPPSDDTASVLRFCRFLEGAAHGALLMPRNVPMKHWAFYAKTVERLVAAGELPCEVQQDFKPAR